jgi:hypothetical protein
MKCASQVVDAQNAVEVVAANAEANAKARHDAQSRLDSLLNEQHKVLAHLNSLLRFSISGKFFFVFLPHLHFFLFAE